MEMVNGMPMLPDETVRQLQQMIESGMSPDQAISMMTQPVQPEKFGGRKQPMGALPQAPAPMQQIRQAPMNQNQMAQYLQNKIAEIKGRMGSRLGALPMAGGMNARPR